MIPKRYYLTLISLSLILVTQTYLAWRARRVLREWRVSPVLWPRAVAIVSLLFVLSTTVAFDNVLRLPREFAIAINTLMNLYGLTCAVIVAILVAFDSVVGRLPTAFQRDRRRALKVLGNIGIAAPVAAAGFGVFIERTNFEITETTVGFRSLPKALDGLRVLQISDIHLGPYLSARELARVVDASNELKPHIAVVTGDLITSKRDPLNACLAELARLRADAPTMGCLGNHEIYADAVDYTVNEGAKLGIEFLRYQAKTIQIRDAMLNVVGVDYEPFDMAPRYLRETAELVRPGMFNLLLSHNPDVIPTAAQQGFDLTVSGHMHGGQITCEFLNPMLNPAKIMTPYVRGLYRIGEKAGYVTRGIGTLGVPVRFGARPEMALLTLRSI